MESAVFALGWGESAIDRRKIVGAQRERCGAEVLTQMSCFTAFGMTITAGSRSSHPKATCAAVAPWRLPIAASSALRARWPSSIGQIGHPPASLSLRCNRGQKVNLGCHSARPSSRPGLTAQKRARVDGKQFVRRRLRSCCQRLICRPCAALRVVERLLAGARRASAADIRREVEPGRSGIRHFYATFRLELRLPSTRARFARSTRSTTRSRGVGIEFDLFAGTNASSRCR